MASTSFTPPDGFEEVEGEFNPPDGFDSDPKFYEIEKQPGLPKTGKDALAQAGRVGKAVFKGAFSPLGQLQAAAQIGSEVTGQLGADVARAVQPTIGTVPARAAGFATSLFADPTAYAGVGVGAKAGSVITNAIAKKTAPGALKFLADVPEEATKVLLNTKNFFKTSTGSEGAIEGAVRNVQSALKESLSREGKAIADVEKKLKIFRTPDQIREEIAAKTGIGGYEASLRQMSPDQLLVQFQTAKKAQFPTDGQKIATMQALKEAMNSRVSGFKVAGDTTDGLLKTTAKEASQIIKDTPGGEALRSVQAQYARARTTYDSLKKLLADEGQAEQTLINVFKSQAPKYKTIRRNLAALEKASGQPVFTELFKEFAAKELKKLVGRPGTAVMTTAASSFLGPLAPVGVAAAQSPAVLSRLVAAAPKLATVPGAAVGAGAVMSQQKTSSDRLRTVLDGLQRLR